MLLKVLAIAPAFACRFFDESVQFRVVGDATSLGVPFDARVKALGQHSEEDDLGQLRGVGKVRGHPEGLCLEFGAGRRRLAGSAPAPPARARIWTLLLGVPGYVSSRFPLSAAQSEPNDRGEIEAFVASSALCRAALSGATSSPTGEMMLA